jgi:ubiquinone biosynthesis accessory factor UbiJ
MSPLPIALTTGLQERLVLLLNHLLSREPAAMERLRPLAGQTLVVKVSGQPGWAPQLPPLWLAVTPAGMLERLDTEPMPQLSIDIDGSNPAQSALWALRGERRGVTVSGDVATASAVNWLFENLRWDLGDELARLVGPAPAHLLEQAAQSVRAAIGRLLTPR